MSNYKFSVGDKVHYIVQPFGLPDFGFEGTVVERTKDGPEWTKGKVTYYVYWDHIDRAKFPATPYTSIDLAAVS